MVFTKAPDPGTMALAIKAAIFSGDVTVFNTFPIKLSPNIPDELDC